MNRPTVYETLMLIMGCTVCYFIVIEGLIMLIRPTAIENSDIRKQVVALIYFIAGNVTGILAAKLVKKDKEL